MKLDSNTYSMFETEPGYNILQAYPEAIAVIEAIEAFAAIEIRSLVLPLKE